MAPPLEILPIWTPQSNADCPHISDYAECGCTVHKLSNLLYSSAYGYNEYNTQTIRQPDPDHPQINN